MFVCMLCVCMFACMLVRACYRRNCSRIWTRWAWPHSRQSRQLICISHSAAGLSLPPRPTLHPSLTLSRLLPRSLLCRNTCIFFVFIYTMYIFTHAQTQQMYIHTPNTFPIMMNALRSMCLCSSVRAYLYIFIFTCMYMTEQVLCAKNDSTSQHAPMFSP